MKKEKVLILRLSSLGDVIFNIPLANSLKNAGYEVSWLVSEKGYDILKNNPSVDNVILAPYVKWKKGNKNGKCSFLSKFNEWREIRHTIKEQHFDIAIDSHGMFKSLLFLAFSGIKRRIIASDAKEFSSFAANEFVKFPAKNDYSINIIDKYLLFAKYLNIPTENAKITTPESTKECIEKIDNILKKFEGINKPLVILCPVTTWANKHWDKEKWKELVEKVGDKYNIVLTGTKNDYDYIEYINQGKHLNIAGQTSLMELLELFKRSDLVLSLDSGSTHLAHAAGKPAIISIFCCTPKTLYEPVGEKYISLSGNLSCQPCHKRKCPLKTNECTHLPAVREVLDAIHKVLPS